MLTPAPDCNLCPRLCESRTSVVTGEGPTPCEILIIAEAPSGIADATVEPMAGWTVKALKYLVTEVAMRDWSTVRLTYATKCRPPRKKGKVEVYCNGRYVTLTGNHLPDAPTKD